MAEQRKRSARARKAAAAEPTVDDQVEDEPTETVEPAREVNPERVMRAGGYINRDDGRGWVLEQEE